MNKLLVLMLVIILVMLWVPDRALAQTSAACEVEYTVQAGDSLSKIADKYLGNPSAFAAIVEATNTQASDRFNAIENPDFIRTGWLLCIPSDQAAAAGSPSAPPGLSPQELANATYQSQFTQSGSAPLTDGTYSEAAAPGSASQTSVTLTDNIAYGQLNNRPTAVVILVTDLGGSGTFFDLALLINQAGQPVNVAIAPVGDRVQINSVTIENNQIVVDMIQAGPDDPLCCPSQQVMRTYELQGDQLLESSTQVVQPDSGSASALSSTTWVLNSINGKPILPETTITAEFSGDGRVAGTSGCNSYSATFETEANTISIGLGITTLQACPESIMQQETAYLAALDSAATFEIEGDTLTLLNVDGTAVATFSALQPVALPGTSWIVTSYNNGKQAVVSVIIGTELTADFGEDSLLTGLAGCNNYSTGYELDGEKITIGPAATTRKMCAEPEGIMEQEQQFLAALERAATYRIELNRMEIRTDAGALAATFEAAP